MSDHPIGRHELLFDDHETRLTGIEETVARSEDWRTGGELQHRGAEARILKLEGGVITRDQVDEIIARAVAARGRTRAELIAAWAPIVASVLSLVGSVVILVVASRLGVPAPAVTP